MIVYLHAVSRDGELLGSPNQVNARSVKSLAIGTLIFLAVFAGIVSLVPQVARAEINPPSCPFPPNCTLTGDWIVQSGDVSQWVGKIITAKGNITVEAGGTLIFQSTKVRFDNAFAGQYHIEVKAGGALRIVDSDDGKHPGEPGDADYSKIFSVDPAKPYLFWVQEGATLALENSYIENAGLPISGPPSDFKNVGLYTASNDTTVRWAWFRNNTVGLVVDHSIFEISNTTFESNQAGLAALNNSDVIVYLANATNNGVVGFYANHSFLRIYDSIASDNGFSMMPGPPATGLFAENESWVYVRNGSFRDNAWAAIGVVDSPLSTQIQTSTIIGNGVMVPIAGIMLTNASAVLSDNNIQGNGGSGVSSSNGNLTLERNTLESNDDFGVFVSVNRSGLWRTDLTENRIANHTSFAVGASGNSIVAADIVATAVGNDLAGLGSGGFFFFDFQNLTLSATGNSLSDVSIGFFGNVQQDIAAFLSNNSMTNIGMVGWALIAGGNITATTENNSVTLESLGFAGAYYSSDWSTIAKSTRDAFTNFTSFAFYASALMSAADVTLVSPTFETFSGGAFSGVWIDSKTNLTFAVNDTSLSNVSMAISLESDDGDIVATVDGVSISDLTGTAISALAWNRNVSIIISESSITKATGAFSSGAVISYGGNASLQLLDSSISEVSGYGVQVTGSGDFRVTIVNSTIQEAAETGLSISNPMAGPDSSVRIENSSFLANDVGAEILANSTDYVVSVRNAVFAANRAGGFMVTNGQVDILSSEFTANGDFGISLSSSNATSSDLTVKYNKVGIDASIGTTLALINSTMDNLDEDLQQSSASNITTLNTHFDRTRVKFLDGMSTLTVRWYLDVYVQTTQGVPLSGASISVEDAKGSTIFADTSGADGHRRWIEVTQYLQNSTLTDYYTPHNVSATFGSYVPAYEVISLNSSTTVTISLVDNVPPTASISDLTIDEGSLVILDGSASTDDQGIVNYTWSFVYSGNNIVLYGKKVSFLFAKSGVYTITLEVKDAQGNSDTDTAAITVRDADTPVVRSMNPDSGTTNIAVDQSIVIVFSEPMDPTATVAVISFSEGVEFDYEWQQGNTVLVLTPRGGLAYDTTYTVTIGTGAKDAEGTALQPTTFTFSTVHQPTFVESYWWSFPIILLLVVIGILLYMLFFRGKKVKLVPVKPEEIETEPPAEPKRPLGG